MDHFASIASQFNINGELIRASLYGSGHIHETYLANFLTHHSTKRFVFQRINHNVFKDPEIVMRNIDRITRHIRSKVIERNGDTQRECLEIVPSRGGDSFIIEEDGSYWRAFFHIQGASTFDVPEHPNQIYEAATAYGSYQYDLSDLPTDQLGVTIPDFHNTPLRFETLLQSIQKDPGNRAVDIKDEISFVLTRQQDTKVIWDMLAQGEIPDRINHNDAKLNNVLLDDISGVGICVIDLDTTMPGTPLYDFGDMVRTGACTAAEDEIDTSKVKVDLELFRQMAGGYLKATRTFLTPNEIQLLAFAGKTITLEQGIRFLTDYLDGDKYYKINFPEHNLVRARTQLALIADIEKHMDVLEEIVHQEQKE